MTVRKHTVEVVTASDGTATAYSPYISGLLDSIQYVKTDYANGVDFTMTLESTGENVWTQSDVNAAVTVRPRAPTHSVAGVAALYASGGTAVNGAIALGRDRIKIVLAQGGNVKTGEFVISVHE